MNPIHFIHHGNREQSKYATTLKQELEKRGITVYQELNDGYKHIDLAIPKAKLNIEVDGIQHLTDHRQILADLARGYYSNKLGFDTMHIPNEMIKSHIHEIADALAEACRIREQQIIVYFIMKSARV